MGENQYLKDFALQNASSIRKRWYDLVLASFPPETAQFMRSKKDQFANPVGYTLNTALDDVMKCLQSGAQTQEIAASVHPLIRIKAVQEFLPSEAVSVVLKLKQAVRETLSQNPSPEGDSNVLEELDPVVDELLCSCFDLYVDCRQKLSDIKEEELKRNLYMLLKKAEIVDTYGQGDG